MSNSLRPHIQRIIEDMRARKYRPQRFIQALAWPHCDDEELLDRARTLLRNPDGQTAAYTYKHDFPDGVTLEDVVIEHGIALGFDEADIDVARHKLGTDA